MNSTPPEFTPPPIGLAAAVEPAVVDAVVTAGPADLPADALQPAAEPTPQAKAPELSPAACAAALAQQFPALFGAGVLLPVKLRIQTDIQQRAPHTYSRKTLSLFLHRHTTSTPYIRALLAAAQRFDLDGQPAGEISDEHRAAAVAEMERRRAITQERRAAERKEHQRAQQAQQAPTSTDSTTPDRPPRPAGGRPPRRADAPGRAQGPGPARLQGRPAALPEADPGPRPPAPPVATNLVAREAEPGTDAARRERSSLLRSFESSTLAKSNFLVLKRMSEAELDAQLALARQERQQNPQAQAPQNPNPPAPRDFRPGRR